MTSRDRPVDLKFRPLAVSLEPLSVLLPGRRADSTVPRLLAESEDPPVEILIPTESACVHGPVANRLLAIHRRRWHRLSVRSRRPPAAKYARIRLAAPWQENLLPNLAGPAVQPGLTHRTD